MTNTRKRLRRMPVVRDKHRLERRRLRARAPDDNAPMLAGELGADRDRSGGGGAAPPRWFNRNRCNEASWRQPIVRSAPIGGTRSGSLPRVSTSYRPRVRSVHPVEQALFWPLRASE